MSPDARNPRFVCVDCGRSYKAVETLNRHRKNHVAGIQYTCDTCNASFKRKDLLDRHSLIHDTGRPAANTSRSGKACDRCSRLKTKCEGSTPCTRCEKGGHFCTYRHTLSRAKTGRSSAGTLSPSHSPRLSIDEGRSPGSLTYSLSDPGDPMPNDQSWDADDTWAQGLWTTQESTQDSTWQWPSLDSNAERNSVFDAAPVEPLQAQNPPPTGWNEPTARNILQSQQSLPVPGTDVEDIFAGYTATSWPQYSGYIPQIDPALSGDLSYSMDMFAALDLPSTYTACSQA